jgi:predicted anti-sigma-YlaC factor YlaD
MHSAVTCDQCFDLLDEFVELELEGADASVRLAGVRAHLEGCPACREDHDSLQALLEADAGNERG